jgi:protein-tyrosine phosphatase
MKTALFLCSGNYYRSRFAEELFNHHAKRYDLDWMAHSRALAIERGINNVGPLSPLVLKALDERCMVVRGVIRPPLQCTVADLETADWIVALNETEHRPLLLERFPGWQDRAEYWQVEDIGFVPAEAALSLIESEIDAMLKRIRALS